MLELGMQTSWAFAIFISGTTVLTGLAFVGIIYYGGWLVLSGVMTVGDLTAFLLNAITIAGAMGGLAGVFGTLMQAAGANERVYSLLDRQAAIPQTLHLDDETPVALEGGVELRDIDFAYPSRPAVPVLRNLTLRLRPGEVVALVGASGGGKSTVCALIERFYDPQAGAVLLDGRDLRGLDAAAVRRSIGLVAQEPALFACSIADNIRYARPDASDAEVRDAVEKSNAATFIQAFPDGYDTLVGERGVRLSGGQKQRIAIARAILKNPKIVCDEWARGGPRKWVCRLVPSCLSCVQLLLLDEATSALDAESEHLVQEALEQLMVGRSVLIIAHRLLTVVRADRVCVVQDGYMVETGTHDELMSQSSIYAALARRQLSS